MSVLLSAGTAETEAWSRTIHILAAVPCNGSINSPSCRSFVAWLATTDSTTSSLSPPGGSSDVGSGETTTGLSAATYLLRTTCKQHLAAEFVCKYLWMR